MTAIVMGSDSIVKDLLEHKNIDVNLQNKDGNTALLIALFNNRHIIAKQLIHHKDINLDIQNNKGENVDNILK